MKKIGFPLTTEDGWPPFEVEYIWVDTQGSNFRIRNVPFFVKGVAVDDVISATLDNDNYVLKWKLISASSNSTMWIIEHKETDLLEKLYSLGCDVEIGNPKSLLAVNIPASIDVNSLDEILAPYEDVEAISVAVPADRMS